MRKVIIILLLAMASLASRAEHYVGIALSPAATWQLDTLLDTHSLPGMAIDVGVVYHYQFQSLLLKTGFDMAWCTMRQGLDTMLWGQTQNIIHSRVDAMRHYEISIPLMIGAKVHDWYAMGGVKLAFSSTSQTEQRAIYAILQTDDRYYDDFNEVYKNELVIRSKGSIELNPDLRVRMELGKQFKLVEHQRIINRNPVLHVGLFAEYSVLGHPLKQYIGKDNVNTSGITLDHIYSQYIGQDPKINHLYAGIRVTLLFDVGINDCRCEEY